MGDPSTGAGCAAQCGTELAGCIAECIAEYRATTAEEACLDRDGGWPQLAASHGVVAGTAAYVEGLCYSLRECGDFW